MKTHVLFTLIGSLLLSIAGYAQTTYKVGDRAQGGIVVWVDETGQHGLVCAEESVQDVPWIPSVEGSYHLKENLKKMTKITTRDGIYAGKENTERIITLVDDAMYSDISESLVVGEDNNGLIPYAARICALTEVTEGDVTYTDWYLPSSKELLLFLDAAESQQIVFSELEQWKKIFKGITDTFWSSSVVKHTKIEQSSNMGISYTESSKIGGIVTVTLGNYPKGYDPYSKFLVLPFRAF